MLDFASKTEIKTIALVFNEAKEAHACAMQSTEFGGVFPEIIDVPENFLSKEKYELFKKRKSFSLPEAIFMMKIEIGLLRSKQDLHIGNFGIKPSEKEFWRFLSSTALPPKKNESKFKVMTTDAICSNEVENIPECLIFENAENLLLKSSSFKISIFIQEVERVFLVAKEFAKKKEKEIIKSAERNLSLMWGRLGIFAEKVGNPNTTFYQDVILDKYKKSLEDFQKAKENSQAFLQDVKKIEKFIPDFLKKDLEDFSRNINDFFCEEHDLSWIRLKSSGAISLFFSAEENKKIFSKEEFSDKKIIFYGEIFNKEIGSVFSSTLGLKKIEEVNFNFSKNKKNELEVKYASFSAKEKSEKLFKILSESKKSSLILFSSKRDLEKFHLLNKESLKNIFLLQKISPERISEQMKGEKVLLFATTNYILGKGMQSVLKELDFQRLIIFKIPFDMPRDPAEEKVSQSLKNAFLEWTVPRSAIRLSKIISPFIKKENTEEVLFLDDRIFVRNYGKDFLKLMPEVFTSFVKMK